MGAVLIIDDIEDLRYSLSTLVKKEGHIPHLASSGQEAIEVLKSSVIDIIFLDIGLPDINGIQLIETLKKIASDVDIVMLTGHNDAKSAVESLQAGAVDYIVKPFELLEFKTILHRLMDSKLMQKRIFLSGTKTAADTIICSCEKMRPVKETIQMAAEVDAPVLITGETGTGKELVARAIHDLDLDMKGVFVKVDCGTLSENLIESELFGYDKGAFTDARTEKKGLVEVANGGTLFLDEIGNLPIALQPKLLRLIEESTFRKVGGIKDISVKLRIIAATNAKIENEIEEGTFREDLFYRLNVIPIALPPLRDRGEDILLLANFFLHKFTKEMRKHVQGFSASTIRAMMKHDWPGNIREMRNLVEREVIFSKKEWLSLPTLAPYVTLEAEEEKEEFLTLQEMEKKYIKKILQAVHNNKSKTARILDISRTTLRKKLEE